MSSRLLAFVDVFVGSPDVENVVQALAQLPNVEELYEVTGECKIITHISATNIEEFSQLLNNKIHKINGVKNTVTSLVLSSPKGPRSGGIT